MPAGRGLSALGFAAGAAGVKLTPLGSTQACHPEPPVCPRTPPDAVASEEVLSQPRAVTWGSRADCRRVFFRALQMSLREVNKGDPFPACSDDDAEPTSSALNEFGFFIALF